VGKSLPIVAIVGRANVGKSSLFNAVLGRREAIVAREAGTTRDAITAKAEYENHQFWIVDTAGMKDPDDDFELTIQEQIKEAADSADMIWVTIEAQTIISEEDRRIATMALKTKKPVILVVNKMDLAPRTDINDFRKLGVKEIQPTTTTQNRGIDELLEQTTKQLPRAVLHEASDRLHLAILGRPNVGKSALFNALAKKQQAIVADRAGTTRDVNRSMIKFEGREIELMDTAGIRRSGKIEVGVEKFSVLRALAAIEESDICLLLMDVNELNTALDQKIAGLIKEAGKGLVIVVNKWDALDYKTPFSRDHLAARIKHEFMFVPWAPLVFTSTITGQNVTKLFELTLEIAAGRSKQIKTPELNRWLRHVVDKHPPAGLKNKNPKLRYMVQETEQSMPSFKIFGADTRFLHWSYKRYMDREFRESFGFAGTPVKFWFIDKNANPANKIDRVE